MMLGAVRGSRLFYCSLLNLHNKSVMNGTMRTYLKQRRKPAHLPTAKTKLYTIPVHPYFPPDEVKLIEDLLSEYKRRISSLGRMFRTELEKTTGTTAIIAAEAAAAEEHKKLMEMNNLENERVRKIREETLEREFEEKMARLLEMHEEMENKKQEKEKMLLEAIEKAKEETYITHETLEQAIEHALDNPVNYNFCIDLNGQVYWETEGTKNKYKEMYENASSIITSLA